MKTNKRLGVKPLSDPKQRPRDLRSPEPQKPENTPRKIKINVDPSKSIRDSKAKAELMARITKKARENKYNPDEDYALQHFIKQMRRITRGY